MSAGRRHVVFDAMVFIQALISGRGASAACLERVWRGEAILFVSEAMLEEVEGVALRPELTRRYRRLTEERVAGFLAEVRAKGVMVTTPPKAITLPRDAKDEAYTDLAVAVNAAYLVTWNERHLTYLMRRDTPEGEEFCGKYPEIRIVTPVEFLREVGEA